ncbi:MAG: antiterminator Q family protein [Rubrivivax sp.]
MARIEYIRQRLENWARWCAQQDNHGLGYPTQTAFARLGGKGSRAELGLPIAPRDAAEIDEAVKSLRFTQSHLYMMLTLHYAKSLPRHQVARLMCRAESTIKRQLEDADHAIARWLQSKHRARQQLDSAPIS